MPCSPAAGPLLVAALACLSLPAVAVPSAPGDPSRPQAAPAEPESPWLITPTISANPKLGTTVGGVFGYVHRFDAGSSPSLITSFANYSDTDSYIAGLYADVYFGADTHKITSGYLNGKIRNEYDDFLGTGIPAKTEDNMESFFVRYAHQLSGDWYLGAQAIISDYIVASDGAFDIVLDQIGLTGFQSNGLGLVAEYDSRDHPRNPHRGQHLVAHNVAYRESLGGEESFDALQANYSHYLAFGDGHVLATNARGRWTRGAPTAGFSSLNMRGYTRGNYLGENYTHLNLDARFKLYKRWGASLFGGIGCLYESLSDCNDGEALYPMLGAGVIFDLKPAAGIVLRLEYAKGESDNEAYYLSVGQPF